MKTGEIIRSIIYAGLGICAGLVFFETSLQIISSTSLGKVFPAIEPQLGKPDADMGYNLVPGTKALWTRENRAFVEINQEGLRDFPVCPGKPEDLYRIALSGDSIVESLQVETPYVFDNVAEKALRLEGRNIEILNFGKSGSGPLEQLIRLEKQARPLSTDMSIMLIQASDFISGKLLDDSKNPAYNIDSEKNAVRSYGFRQRFSQRHADKITGKTFLFLLRHSHIFRMIYYKRQESLWQIIGLPDYRNSGPNHLIQQNCDPTSMEEFHKFWIQHLPEKNWIATLRFLEETAAYNPGHKMIIGLYMPLAGMGCEEQKKQREEIIKSATQTMERYGIRFVDWNAEVLKTLPEQSESMNLSSLYGFGISYGQGHLNYKGHQKYAEALKKIIDREADHH